MMKPKFRAWDSEANIMIYSDHRTRKLYDVYYGFEMNEKGELECRWEGDFKESQVLDGGILDNIMQSTGLKDKNGVEVFEGDIVEVIWNFTTFIGVVVYDQSEAGFKATNEIADYDTTFMYLTGNDSVEVIGNIYKDTELLGRRIGEE